MTKTARFFDDKLLSYFDLSIFSKKLEATYWTPNILTFVVDIVNTFCSMFWAY